MTTRNKKSKAAIKKDIIDFLNSTSGQIAPKSGKYSCGMVHRNALVPAPSYKDSPRATPLEFSMKALPYIFLVSPAGR